MSNIKVPPGHYSSFNKIATQTVEVAIKANNLVACQINM